jgi:pseudomonalisin
MHSNTLRTRCYRSAVLLAMLAIVSLAAQAQRTINDADRVTLHGNTHPLARAEFDRGSANAATAMNNMVLSLAVRQDAQAQLQQLLADQQNPSSPNFHKWLTPLEFGMRFGPTDQDIADATSWLKSQGFRIEEVANGRMWINFSGDVQKVQRAFQTQIHQFSVDGEMHHANTTDPTIPRALSGLVNGVVSLNDFPKKPNSTGTQLPPDFTAGNGAHFISPADFALIYNVNPLYNGAPAIDGTGQTIAIVGRSDINLADVQFFRSFFGLPSNDPVFINNGPDPGNLGGGEETEADLDVEWTGAVARNATIKLVISQSTLTTDGVDLSAQYIVDNNVAPIMTTSFGLCEAFLGTTGNGFWNNLWAQAAAEGITSFVAAGDSGAAGCDPTSSTLGSLQAVNGLSSTPNNISVGGTLFNEGTGTFWSTTNNPADQSSVLSYIPEVAWNESGATAGGSNLRSTGGGPSSIYPKPAYQAGPGVPADGLRDIPDVALTSGGHDGYLIIQGHTASASGLGVVGGTSAASPSFAGLMALVVQQTGSLQGNANPVFYQLGQNQAAGGAVVYHDITSGNNSVPGVTGFSAGAGYDMTTGWGSVDANALVTSWAASSIPDFGVVASPASQTVNQGSTTTYAVTVTAIAGYSNVVSLSVSGLPAGATPTFTPASVTGSGTSSLAISTASTTPAGSYALTITGTDGVLTHTASVTLVVNPVDFSLSATPAQQSIPIGGTANYTATVSAINGYAGTVSFSVSGLPAGATPAFSPASVTGSGSSSLSITTTVGTTPAGTYALTITGSDGVLTHSASVTLVVNAADFSLTATPITQTVLNGATASYTATVAALNGYAGTVSFSVSGLPAGATPTFTPASVIGSGSSSLSITTTAGTTPNGSFPLTITATDGVLTHSANVTLTVDNFFISAAPASQTIIQGQPTSYSVSLTTAAGYAGTVTFSVAGLPASALGTFSPASLTGSGTSTFNITTSLSTPVGTYPLTISASDGVSTQTASVTLVVNSAADFSLTISPSSQSVIAGQNIGYGVTVNGVNGFTAPVSLSISGLPAGATATFNPSTVSGSGLSSLSIVTAANTPGGSYTLTVTGTSGALVHNATTTLIVLAPDFSLSASPTSQEIIVGQNTSFAITQTALNNYQGTVSFTVSGLPSGATPTFSPASLTASGSTTLSITTSASTPPGTYPLTITGTDALTSHSISVTLVVDAVPTADFIISAPAAITVKRNSSGSETVTVTGISGFTGTVNLTISGVPSLVTATLAPTSVTGSGSSTLTFVVDHRAQQGVYHMTVTGTSGPLVHSTPVTLTVN